MTHPAPESPSDTPPLDPPSDVAVDPVHQLMQCNRHDGWTLQRQLQFIDLLAQGFGIAASARALGMSATGAYALRKRSPDLAALWDAALEEGRLRNYDTAIACGLDGYTTPLYRRGRLAGVRHRHDNRLLYAACYGRRYEEPG